MPKLKRDDDGSKRRNQKCDDGGFECRNWKCDSECQTENVMMMALNAETEKQRWWLWTLKLRCDSERRTKQNMALNTGMSDVMALNAEWRYGSKRWTKMWFRTPNEAKHGSERRTKQNMALNAEMSNVMALIAKWRCSSERRNRDVIPNAEWSKTLLWTPKWEM